MTYQTWYAENKERVRAYKQNYYKTNELSIKQKSADRYKRQSLETLLIRSAKRRSQLQNLEFDISVTDISIPKLCPILNVPMLKGTMTAPSLDRIDPTKGYVKGNVWVISRKANVMKNDATPEELRRFAAWVNQSVR